MQESYAEQVEMLAALGTGATKDQIANLLKRHNGNMEIVASSLIDGNFGTPTVTVTEPEERGRTMTKAAPALPPRRKHSSPVDNSKAIVPFTGGKPPQYDEMEDDDMKKALALSMEDQGPPPLEPVPEEYGPFQDVRKYDSRNLDSGTDHALRQALEASLNDGKNNLAADLYVERPAQERGRENDGRPVAFRSSDQNSLFVPPVFQALMALPQLRARLKQLPSQFTPKGDEEIKEKLELAWHDAQLTREMICHAECTQQAYIDIKPWTGEWTDTTSTHSPMKTASQFLERLTRNLNLALPSPSAPLFLPTIDNLSNQAEVPKTPLAPHVEVTKPEIQLYYVIPLTMGVLPPENNNLVDILEYNISNDEVGCVRETLPDVLAFKLNRVSGGGTGKFGFPVRLWLDRWVMDKREFVVGKIKAREKEIEEQLKQMESESLKLKKCEGRDTLVDLRACIRHFELTATDGGDPKRRARNENTLHKLKSILKDIEDKLAEHATKTEELNTERSKLWDLPELQTIPYDLQAVVIHDGLLGRTHMFSYVRHNGKWWKVVDDDVTEASEETVLGDSSGVHLGSGAFITLYSKPTEEKELPWPRKVRMKSQKLDEEFRANLPQTVRYMFEKAVQPISAGDSEEEEYMDAEEHIIVESDPVVEEVDELAEGKPDKQGDETDKRSDGMQDVVQMRDVD
ncbi:ubiquitin carboxyl-terminal hydrolase [Rhizoctonia solani AG-3 Rhs1AP]|uniref:Ubiquitin carboxyl-terminal hydrolase n=1 Tax=Rhizoctonia solani AG-3 Rhs1AP TaxID=1086054 RepID=X8JBJ6_9AGAM|nr:ubiquitin carboxyl-terminal hydrolase [Rhizoctonia solani AG-3 Rhs1AP]